jgi:hypothetical protein
MHYEINVALNGKHFFATHDRSITTLDKLKQVAEVIAKKFPESEGYSVTIMKWETYGHEVDLFDVLKGD